MNQYNANSMKTGSAVPFVHSVRTGSQASQSSAVPFVKKGQNFIEFVLIFPLLVMFLFATVELAFFWKSHIGVQSLANQIASNAALYTELDEFGQFNPLILRLDNLLNDPNKPIYKSVTGENLTFTPGITDGSIPYAVYQFTSNETASNGRPKLIIQINLLNPEKIGVETQVSYIHETILLKARYMLPNGEEVEVIPDTFQIQSSWVKQYVHY